MGKSKTLIIIDWDDTLFPTTWVHDNNISILGNENKNQKIFSELDTAVVNLLFSFSKRGKVVIVTNAANKWVDISSEVMPKTKEFIKNNVNVISARDIYKKKFPSNSFMWKRLVFKDLALTHFMYRYNTEQIISVGDADYEYKALINLYNGNKGPKRILKSVKLIRYPNSDVLLDQLLVLRRSVQDICAHNSHIDLEFENKV